jgi:NAD(P)H-dependent FMN reductase
MSRLQIIVASTRPGRTGPAIGDWMVATAKDHGGYDDVELIDLAEVNLPFLDEPHHPAQRRYTRQHTRDWSATVDAADGFVFVTPEYNNSFNAPLKNALDYLHHEWRYKPAGFVGYGGTSSGTRAVAMLKPVVSTLKMTPVTEAVYVPLKQCVVDGSFVPNESLTSAATAMLNELARMGGVLASLREDAS